MNFTKIYYVAGKEFSNKQKAVNYENELRNNLKLRAWNLKLYYWKISYHKSIRLINHFCNYHKFNFGKYKDKYIGEIIMKDKQYIIWCIKNIPMFELNKEEEALLTTSWKYSIGGYKWDITHDIVETTCGEQCNLQLINWEKEEMIKNYKSFK